MIRAIRRRKPACIKRSRLRVSRRRSRWNCGRTPGLVRYWLEEARSEAAHQSLAEVHGKFKEGFDTHDLKHAKQVLEEIREHAQAAGKNAKNETECECWSAAAIMAGLTSRRSARESAKISIGWDPGARQCSLAYRLPR